jgi:hypothetical protein
MDDFPETITVDLKLTDESGKLILRDTFGSITTLDGRRIEITRSLSGTTFFLELDKHVESVNLNSLFQDWAKDFTARADQKDPNA